MPLDPLQQTILDLIRRNRGGSKGGGGKQGPPEGPEGPGGNKGGGGKKGGGGNKGGGGGGDKWNVRTINGKWVLDYGGQTWKLDKNITAGTSEADAKRLVRLIAGVDYGKYIDPGGGKRIAINRNDVKSLLDAGLFKGGRANFLSGIAGLGKGTKDGGGGGKKRDGGGGGDNEPAPREPRPWPNIEGYTLTGGQANPPLYPPSQALPYQLMQGVAQDAMGWNPNMSNLDPTFYPGIGGPQPFAAPPPMQEPNIDNTNLMPTLDALLRLFPGGGGQDEDRNKENKDV